MDRRKLIEVAIFSIVLLGIFSWLAGFLYSLFARLNINDATPLTWYLYAYHYGHLVGVKKHLALSGFLAGAGFLLVLVAILKPRGPSPFGDARWARESDIVEAGLRAQRGLLVGKRGGRFLCVDGFTHVLCFAPTRSGKGVGIVVPNLLNWPDSIICHDIKGENYSKTSGFRAASGQKVYFFNPADPNGFTHCYNCFDFVSDKPGLRVDDVQKIAHLIIAQQDFWNNEARTLFVGLVLYLMDTRSEAVTFGGVLRALRGPANFVEFIANELDTRGAQIDPVAYMALNAFIQKADKERSGVMSTLNSALELWTNPLIDAATSRSDFDLRTLKKIRTTIYVGVTPNNLKRLRPLLQVFYQQAIDLHTTKEPDLAEEPYSMFYLMDEFASLGPLTQFQDGIAFFASYRVRVLLIVQDTNQLETHYGRPGKETFLSNCAVRLTYAANSYDTAKLISNVLGTFGAKTESESISKSLGFDMRPGSKSESQSKTARPLLLPHEVMQLPRKQEIVMVEAAPPVRAKKIVYYKDKAFKARIMSPVALPQINPIINTLPGTAVDGRTLQAVATPLSDDEMAALADELSKLNTGN